MSLAVFGFTLIVTKSSLFACKREFITQRYEASKINGSPSLIHTWFYKMFTCPMCLGTWVAAFFVILWPVSGHFILDWLAITGANWLLHVAEEFGFNISHSFENNEKENNPEKKD